MDFLMSECIGVYGRSALRFHRKCDNFKRQKHPWVYATYNKSNQINLKKQKVKAHKCKRTNYKKKGLH